MRNYEGYHRSQGPREPSAAQRRVLDELAAGRSNPQIATALGLTVETVKWHVAQLLADTGCPDRVALGRWWRARTDRRPALAPLLGALAQAAKLALPAAVLLAAAATAVRLGGGDPAPSPAPPAAARARDLALVAAGFGVPTRPNEPGGYAFVLDNTGGAASGVAYTVRLLDAAGGVLDTDRGTIPSVPAGARLGWAGSYASGGPPPARIEVELRALPPAQAGAAVALTAGPAEARVGACGCGLDAVGQVANRGGAAVRDARVSAVAYDAAGALVGGGVAFIPLVRPGQEATVAVRLYASATPARVELHPALASITTIDDRP